MQSAEIRRLLTLAESETKRVGGEGVTVVHLAEVLRRHWPEQLADAFSAEQCVALEHLVRTRAWEGDRTAVEALLNGADDVSSLIVQVRDALADRLAQTTRLLAEQADTEVAAQGAKASPVRQAAGERVPGPGERAGDLPAVEPRAVQGRAIEVAALTTALFIHRSRPILISGAPGSGTSSMLGAVAHTLAEHGDTRPVVSVVPEQLTWRPEGSWPRLIAKIVEPTVLCIDDFDALARLGSGAPNMEFLVQVASARSLPHVQLVLVSTPDGVVRLQTLFEEFAADLVRVDLEPLSGPDLEGALAHGVEELAAAHGVTISALALKAACTPPRSSDRRVHPGLALDRLDAAAVRGWHR